MTEPIQLDSPQANVNRARFAGKDFFTFVDDLIARIQALFVTEFNDFVASGTGVMLIDMVSWAAETLSFYIDRQATESYLETARTRRAVNRLARQVGYKMRAAVSASVDLEVNLKAVWAFDVPIPIGFQFKGPNGLIFQAIEAVTFPAGEGPLSPSRTISCTEGYSVEEIFVSNGQKNQVFRLSPGANRYVADGTVDVRVGGGAWAESPFISFDATDQYEVDYNTDPPLLRFGDAVAGNVPVVGAEIRANYISTGGSAGLVMHDTITEVVNPLVVAFNNIGLTITNPDPSSGGYDRESLEEAKRNAPLYFKAREAAVTRDDYIGLSQAFSDPVAGAVAVAQAFVALGADDDLVLQEYLNDIRGIVNPLAATIDGLTDDAAVALASLSAAQADAATQSGAISTAFSGITTSSTSARTKANAANADVIQAESQVAAARAKVTAIGSSAGPDALTVVSYNELLGYFTSSDTQTGEAKTNLNSLVTDLDSIDTKVTTGQAAQGVLATDLVAIAAQAVVISGKLVDIDTQVNAGFETAIEDLLDLIFAHVDGFLSHNCKSNLVQVPILTKDVDGFLTEPSTALIKALQTYLNGMKEVTQIVEVVSGGPWLIAASIEGIIGVKAGYVQPTVLSNVRKAIDDVLRDREFGKDLHLSDIMSVVAPDPVRKTGGVDGVAYAKLRIAGPIAYLDTYGDLSIENKMVITKGTVTLGTEAEVF